MMPAGGCLPHHHPHVDPRFTRQMESHDAASIGLTDNACHVIIHIVDPRFSSSMESHDAASSYTLQTHIYRVERNHMTRRALSTLWTFHFSSQMESHDPASVICWALGIGGGGGEPPRGAGGARRRLRRRGAPPHRRRHVGRAVRSTRRGQRRADAQHARRQCARGGRGLHSSIILLNLSRF
jgi:hypothetical protein